MEDMVDDEIPEFFICPISLQIMKDPVTAATGITYDRESIEQWLFKQHNTICPVTKLPLLPTSHHQFSDHLTPNHTLGRLIQAWCSLHHHISYSPAGRQQDFHDKNIDNIVLKVISCRDIWVIHPNDSNNYSQLIKALKELESALTALSSSSSSSSSKQVVESGVAMCILYIVVRCYRKRDIIIGDDDQGLREALSILYLVRSSLVQSSKLALIDDDNDEILDALIWVLSADHHDNDLNLWIMKSNAAWVLKIVIQKTNSRTLERLKPEFFSKTLCFLRELGKRIRSDNYTTGQDQETGDGAGTGAINAVLHVLLDSSPWGRNRITMVEVGTIFELIELELIMNNKNKKTTELILGVLFHLCSCADGRADFLNHAAGMAMLARRILKVSPAADDRAILILSLICKFLPTIGVLQEMLRVGVVAKLCMVIQANCTAYLKDRAREMLRNHNNVWKNSPCVEIAATSTNWT